MDKELPSKVNSVTSTSVRVDGDDITSDPQLKSKLYEGSAFFRDYMENANHSSVKLLQSTHPIIPMLVYAKLPPQQLTGLHVSTSLPRTSNS